MSWTADDVRQWLLDNPEHIQYQTHVKNLLAERDALVRYAHEAHYDRSEMTTVMEEESRQKAWQALAPYLRKEIEDGASD